MKKYLILIVVFALVCVTIRAEDRINTDKKIDWYPVLETGLAEATRTGKPILLLSAAPQCLGVPGIW